MHGPIVERARFRRSEGFVGRKIAGEMVLVPLREQIGDLESIYTLNELGSFVWERLDGTATVGEIACAIESEFEAAAEQVRADLDTFLEHLLEIKAIAIAPAVAPTPPPPGP